MRRGALLLDNRRCRCSPLLRGRRRLHAMQADHQVWWKLDAVFATKAFGKQLINDLLRVLGHLHE